MREVSKVRIQLTADERLMVRPDILHLAETAVAPWTSPNFRAGRWLEAAMRAVGRLREAHSVSALGFLTRKGVQLIANDWYRQTPAVYDQYVLTNDSTTYAEWYAPLYPSQVAGKVGRGGRFPEGRVIGEESNLVNQKFGLIESFERELFDDDQTGQIRTRSANLGQSMRVTESFYNIRRFIGLAATMGELQVTASRYATINYAGAAVTAPWSKSLYASARGNRPQSYAALTLTSLKEAYSTLLQAQDPLGNRIIVAPDTLIVSVFDALHAPLLVKPPQGVPYYPAIPGESGAKFGGTGTTGASSGFPGGIMGANPFIGLGINPVVERYSPDWFAAFGQKARGFVMQNRDPLEVIQEDPASGDAFNFDAFRFRSRRRFESDWITGGSRFWYLINPGTGLTVDGDSGATGAF